jgi:hypothetical protein
MSARPSHAFLLAVALAVACARPVRYVDLQSRWYLFEYLPTNGEPLKDESESCPTLQMTLSVINRQDDITIRRIRVGGMKDECFRASTKPWPRGEIPQWDMGVFSCVLPTSLEVLVDDQWMKTRPFPDFMPSALPACVRKCPGLGDADTEKETPPPSRDADGCPEPPEARAP